MYPSPCEFVGKVRMSLGRIRAPIVRDVEAHDRDIAECRNTN